MANLSNGSSFATTSVFYGQRNDQRYFVRERARYFAQPQFYVVTALLQRSYWTWDGYSGAVTAAAAAAALVFLQLLSWRRNREADLVARKKAEHQHMFRLLYGAKQ